MLAELDAGLPGGQPPPRMGVTSAPTGEIAMVVVRHQTVARGADLSALTGAIAAIEPVLRAHADDAERAGSLPEPSWRALHDSGLLLLKAPRELGGFEADPLTQIQVFER